MMMALVITIITKQKIVSEFDNGRSNLQIEQKYLFEI
jgi:hypothetical protein